MKVLWITNIVLPDIAEKLGVNKPLTGGWMHNLSQQIGENKDVSLAVATVWSGGEFSCQTIGNITYFLLPSKGSNIKYNSELVKWWQKTCAEFDPDIIHIHGTEYAHSLACIKSCPAKKYVVSIQGLTGICSRYYLSDIKTFDILKNISFRDILKRDTLFHGQERFNKRGRVEREIISLTQNVIGRTSWDYAHTKAINLNVKYHFCNETLRKSFYSSQKWDIKKKSNYTIFLSQVGSPIKGLHQVLKSMRFLVRDFPNIKIRIGGYNITDKTSFSHKLKLTGYGKYIIGLIGQYGLKNKINFLGSLNEDKMIEEYLNAHVFICPSSIENSPNSLGEAQILGVPSIASYVGGVPDMVAEGVSGLLYRFEEVEMLAENIRKIFTDDNLAIKLSKGGIVAAEKRHNPETNLNETMKIYNILFDARNSIA